MNTNTDNLQDTSDCRCWEWSEPSDDEFETRRKNEVFFRLFTVENGKERNLYKFWGENCAYANSMLAIYKDDHPELGDNCYFSTSGYFIDDNGKRCDSLKDAFRRDDELQKRKKGPIKKIVDSIGTFFRINLVNKLDAAWFWVKNLVYFIRHGHAIVESWSLYDHILSDMDFNLKKMADNSFGFPMFMCTRACEKLGKPIPDDGDYDLETRKLAAVLWRNELLQLRENVLLYCYYREYGRVDADNPELVELDRKYNHTLPYKAGTIKEFDYQKLDELARERWERIWNWFLKYGESLWD